MKEIQGKIKFVAIPLINGMIGYLPLRYEKIGLLSEITEEQAAVFVESGRFVDSGDFGLGNCTYYRDYPNELEDSCEFSAKESLISLLKANDVWIKEWKEKPIDIYYLPDFGCQKHPQECYLNDKEEYEQLPDDLLLIKLT